MAKNFGKYFIAIVPFGDVQNDSTKVKEELKEVFGLKYALKSPAHVTVKMPFSWNEAKEGDLIDKIGSFLKGKEAFSLGFDGFGRFGKRVIFIKTKPNKELNALQSELAEYCKRELNLVKELSDSNYTPHMTVAFKDIKERLFDEYWQFIKSKKFKGRLDVKSLSILKRVEGRWVVLSNITLGESVD
ncbi:2'-5' RNA ligase family protein [Belliella aquatica]|uniref:2'-5' RNA ligase n=1 Tax=Belliella aquatica TaxID=1323734 RepID=A0ABQ1LJF6_9BACT|nr:2'-5' RNA ligase family protein [Belliella aquatica]MCH7404105.1 2'-5' RNA ligase family protein [Belliella aquatica]GGC25357.1 2'-5' RNA ligase [Belliella aquatica]